MKILAVSAMLFCMFTGLNAESLVSANPSNDSITMDFKDARLQSALDILFRGLNKSFVLDSGVDRNVVIPDLSLKGVSFDDALKAITRAAGVTYSKNGSGIYIISPKRQMIVAEPISDPRTPEPEVVAVQPQLKVEKVYLGFLDAQDVAAMFGITGFKSRGSVMVTGANSTPGVGYSNQMNRNNSGNWGMNSGNQYDHYNNPPALSKDGNRTKQPQVPGVIAGF